MTSYRDQQEIAQLFLAPFLGDHAADYDVDAIVDDIQEWDGHRLTVRNLSTDELMAIIEKHENKNQR